MLNRRYLRSIKKSAAFSGGVLIAGGILQCLTIIGIPTGISSLVIGSHLIRLRNRIQSVLALPDEENCQGMNAVLFQLAKYLRIRARMVLMSLLSALGVTGGLVALAWSLVPQSVKDTIVGVLQGLLK
jgi:hypothetical protein